MSNRIKLLICVLFVTCGVVGCEKQQATRPADEDSVENRNADESQEFTWRDAAESTPEQAKAALGDYQDCEPSKRLPLAWPTNRQLWLSGAPFCKFGQGEQAEGRAEHPSRYRISAIAYSSGEPAIIALVPRDEIDVSAEVLEAFDLPELEVEQHVAPQPGHAPRKIARYRRKTIPSSPGQVLGVDLIGDNEQTDRLEEVRVFVTTSDEMVPHVMSPVGPLVARRDLVLPVTTSNLSPTGGAYAEIGSEQVRLGAPQEFPARPARRGDVAPQEFVTFALTERDGDWRDKLASYLADEADREKKFGRAPSGTLSVSADHMAPAHVLRQVLAGAKEAGTGRFKLIGRSVAPAMRDRARYGVPHVVNLALGTPNEHQPLQLTLDLGIDGIDLAAAGSSLAPAEGCPEDGPTLCLRDGEDAASKFGEARTLQDDGKLDAASKRALEGLDAYDWAALYEKLVELKEKYPGETVLHIRLADKQVPVAALVRAMDIARYQIRAPGADKSRCASRVEGNKALLDAQPCVVDRRQVGLFHDVMLVEESAQ